jgi:Trypsin
MHQIFSENKQKIHLFDQKYDFFSDYVSPICLPSQSEVGETFVGETMTVSGWGHESDSSPSIAKVSDYILLLI